MPKVKPKYELAILAVGRMTRSIKFDCVSQDAADGLQKYGRVYTENGMSHWLEVNGCYDFDEVLNYILSNGGGYAS